MMSRTEESREKTDRLLEYIQEFITVNRFAPTVQEMMDGAYFTSKSMVSYHLKRLEESGLIERVPKTPRAIRFPRAEASS